MPANRREQIFSAENLLRVLRTLPGTGLYVVGFSGGADSTALMHALNTIRNQLSAEISAVHINHAVHQDSGQWQAHCESFCREYNIRLTCLQIELKHDTGKGLEAEARSLRYQAITGLLDKNSALLTAHHADDQSETLLLNLMRGAGVDGLSAMPESRPLGKGLLQRPLLGFTNEQLLQYLKQHDVKWIDDPSNQLLDQDRNFLRHDIVPQLEKRWPGVNRRLLLTREAMADARVLLERTADKYLDELLLHPFVLKLSSGMRGDPQLLRLVIRRWAGQMRASPMPAYKLMDFSTQLAKSESRHQCELSWDGWKIRLHQQRLWLFEGSEVQPCPPVKLPPGNLEVYLGKDVGRLVFSGNHSAHKESCPLPAGQPVDRLQQWPGTQLSISGRQSAITGSILHGGIHKKVKKLLQASGVPPWLRNCIPLCQLHGALVAVGDWCFEPSFEAGLKQHHIVMHWQPEHPLLQFVAAEQHTRQAGHHHSAGY